MNSPKKKTKDSPIKAEGAAPKKDDSSAAKEEEKDSAAATDSNAGAAAKKPAYAVLKSPKREEKGPAGYHVEALDGAQVQRAGGYQVGLLSSDEAEKPAMSAAAAAPADLLQKYAATKKPASASGSDSDDALAALKSPKKEQKQAEDKSGAAAGATPADLLKKYATAKKPASSSGSDSDDALAALKSPKKERMEKGPVGGGYQVGLLSSDDGEKPAKSTGTRVDMYASANRPAFSGSDSDDALTSSKPHNVSV